MKRIYLALMLLPCLTACSEVQLASHLTKQALPPSRSQGTFKVGNPYKIEGTRYTPTETYSYSETGIASWYGSKFDGRKTANGETFDMNELTAAHRTLQMPSLVRVTNLENGRSLVVRVNDRGPYKRGRVMDVSRRAAELLGFKDKGTAKVRLDLLPRESMEIAQAAKQGRDTSGYEVALNRAGRASPEEERAVQAAYRAPEAVQPAAGRPAPVTREALAAAPYGKTGLQQVIPGHTRDGAFYPDPVVTEMPVQPTDIYVQAGAFTVADNAYRLSERLKSFGSSGVYPAVVNGRQFYRVRIGPIASVDQADELLSRVLSSGNENAIIVVN